MLDNWQRIEQIIKWAGAASVSAFARDIGLNRGENLYQIKRGNNGISRELAETITSKYPQISKAWLLTGEGDMLPGATMIERYDIPFYKIDAIDVVNGETLPEPNNFISFPLFRGSDFAAFTYSDSMAPDISVGAILFFRETEVDSITPGSMYLVVSRRFRGVRFIRKEPESDKLRLVPKNLGDYDEVVVRESEVERIFQVKGILINKSI